LTNRREMNDFPTGIRNLGIGETFRVGNFVRGFPPIAARNAHFSFTSISGSGPTPVWLRRRRQLTGAERPLFVAPAHAHGYVDTPSRKSNFCDISTLPPQPAKPRHSTCESEYKVNRNERLNPICFRGLTPLLLSFCPRDLRLHLPDLPQTTIHQKRLQSARKSLIPLTDTPRRVYGTNSPQATLLLGQRCQQDRRQSSDERNQHQCHPHPHCLGRAGELLPHQHPPKGARQGRALTHPSPDTALTFDTASSSMGTLRETGPQAGFAALQAPWLSS